MCETWEHETIYLQNFTGVIQHDFNQTPRLPQERCDIFPTHSWRNNEVIEWIFNSVSANETVGMKPMFLEFHCYLEAPNNDERKILRP